MDFYDSRQGPKIYLDSNNFTLALFLIEIEPFYYVDFGPAAILEAILAAIVNWWVEISSYMP